MNNLKKLCILLLTSFLVVSFGITANAEGSVTYDGDANKFIFLPGTKNSPSSLFENFQNVMPGDTLTEQILIKNDTSNGVKIKVYMRSLGARNNTDKFLSQMNLTVQQKGDSVLFSAPADKTAQLADWVCLGTVYSGGEITLDVTLEVPITMGNDYQEKVGYIDWEFKVEERPVEASDPKSPKTGDTGSVFLYSGFALVSIVVLVIVRADKRKRKNI